MISIDAKKKEQLGQLPMAGQQWRPKGDPVKVEDHSFYFIGPDVDVAIPFGIYDVTRDSGWVNVGVDHDTSVFAVESIRRWWRSRGRLDYPQADRLLITADCGGSNSYRYRLWKAELAVFAAETGLTVTVCHYPPATSKWNKIEHRLFSHITTNWRGRPLTSDEVVVNSIAATTTRTGLRVHAELDTGAYPIGIAVSREYVQSLPITPHAYHGTWNYTIASTGPDPVAADDRDRSRTQALTMLADPRLTGMTPCELEALTAQLAPLQAAIAEQRKYQQRGGPRRQAKGDHARPLLTNADKLLVTVLYLRQVCSQNVLIEPLGVASVGAAIAETRKLLHEQRIDVGQTTLLFRTGQDLTHWLDHGPAPISVQSCDALTHPDLTGMSRQEFRALLQKIFLAYAATVEERRHLRRGADRLPGTRGGVFRQKITDADRILATILAQRKLCSLETLAELFGVSRGTLRNAFYDVQPLLEEHGYAIGRADRRYAKAADVLASVATAEDSETPR